MSKYGLIVKGALSPRDTLNEMEQVVLGVKNWNEPHGKAMIEHGVLHVQQQYRGSIGEQAIGFKDTLFKRR